MNTSVPAPALTVSDAVAKTTPAPTRTKLLAGQIHFQIPVAEVTGSDYIEFNRQGLRIRKVKDVHYGRKHQYISFEPLPSVTVFKKRKIHPREVLRAWRKQ